MDRNLPEIRSKEMTPMPDSKQAIRRPATTERDVRMFRAQRKTHEPSAPPLLPEANEDKRARSELEANELENAAASVVRGALWVPRGQ